MNTENPSPPLVPWIILVLILFAGSLGLSFVAYACGGLQSLNLIGGWFGTLNTLFAGLGFAVLIYTMQLQRQQLELTRADVDEQGRLIRRTSFESSFFQMLELHHRNIEAISGKTGTTISKGRAALHQLSDILVAKWGNNLALLADPARARSYYDEFYTLEKNSDYLGHYFRNLYHVLRFIENSAPAESRPMYAKILRAQLFYPELVLIAFNGLSKYGQKNFKPLIERFAFLEQLKESDAALSDWLKMEYAASAFQDE